MFTVNKKLVVCLLASAGFYSTHIQAENVLSCDNENTAITATTTHLTDNNNGTITDPETGLIWKKCSEGQTWSGAGNNCSSGAAADFTWQAALQRAQEVNDGIVGENFSETDWRLPNIKELASIAELRCSDPAINNTVFPETLSAWFWSSSPYAPNAFFARGVSFSNVFDGARVKSNINRVRLVRSGQ
ncbi:hypothetical protein MNBD_GAMMA05-753 [hydrothermal vent metagenome]|uniref:Lcl C-terminal domain-containing protein n=1 Tax=hydrothermal vent metagenome TaxID=652676 RepID=A0A3B0WAY6_9ZZZZ